MYPDIPKDSFEIYIFFQNWKGFYIDNEIKQKMSLELNVSEEGVYGIGSDDIGKFNIKGMYNSKEKTMKFVKQYFGKHRIYYVGNTNSDNHTVICKGKWLIDIEDDSENLEGTFEIKGLLINETTADKDNVKVNDEIDVKMDENLDPNGVIKHFGDQALDIHDKIISDHNNDILNQFKGEINLESGINLGTGVIYEKNIKEN